MRLLDSSTLESIPTVSSSEANSKSDLYTALLSNPEKFRDLRSEYPDVASSKGFFTTDPKHSVRHTVPTSPGPPVFAKARRLDTEKLESARKDFAAMESAGIIRRSSSPWLSPLHMVKKPDGSWRPCGNYRRLNTQTVPDRYPLPNFPYFSSRLHGSKVFTKLDLTKGYYQVPMFTGDIPQKQWMHLPKAYGSYFPRTPSLFCIRC